MNEIKNDRMSIERWKEAVDASCKQKNYRRERGMTETRDDYFVDGVQWADEHPATTQWRSVDEWPKDKEKILMKLDNGRLQYTEWEDDGKGFNSGFAELNFGEGAMMRLPITYNVVAWRPLADVLNEITDHGIIEPQGKPKADNPLLQTPLTSCDLSVRTLNLCKANGIETLGDLTRLHKTDWLKFRNGGKKSLTELDELLTANGLTWAAYD